MVNIKKIESLSELNKFKKQYFEQATSPLDGMWHFGFAPMALHFGFYIKGQLVGYCCINDEGYLLQFYLEPISHRFSQALFTLIAQQNSNVIGPVKGAFVSTAEPEYLSLCLDNSSTFNVNSFMYQHSGSRDNKLNDVIDMHIANESQLDEFVEFAVHNIGAPEQWLNGYYTNLISRKELFGYWFEGKLIAAGECRLFDEYQTDYADLGMIVAKSERGQGIAKKVLSFLTTHASSKGLKAICSTEASNIGAQKAIMNASFSSVNRIVQFEFDVN